MRLRLRILGQVVLIALAAVALARWAHTCAAPGADEAAVVRELTAALDQAARAAPEAAPIALATIPEQVHAATGEVEPATLVRRWATDRGLVLTVDPQVQGVKLQFDRSVTLDAEGLREVLDAHDLVLVRGRASTLHLVHRRNLATKFGPPWDAVEDGETVDPDRIVTRTVSVRHGAGNNIFATVRGFSARDMNRIGNLLYIPGPEQIVVVDFARNVRYYEQLIRSMDVPGPDASGKPLRVVTYRLEAARWEGLRELQGAAQLERLEALVEDGAAERTGVLSLVPTGSGGARQAGARLVNGDARVDVQVHGPQVEVEVGRRAREAKDRVTLRFWLGSAPGPQAQAATDPSDADRRLVVALIP